MPLQSSFTLFILTGCFTAIGGIYMAGNLVQMGSKRVHNPGNVDYFAQRYRLRDVAIHNKQKQEQQQQQQTKV